MYTNEWCHLCSASRALAVGLPIEERDIEEHMDFCLSNDLTLVPTFIALDGETILAKKVGLLTREELEEFIKEHNGTKTL